MKTLREVLDSINIMHNKKLKIVKIYSNRDFSNLFGVKENIDLNYVFQIKTS